MAPAKVWIDRVVENLSPSWALRRQRARIASAYLTRNYEGASVGRRTQGWYRGMTDANSAIGPSLAKLRGVARDLVRNNPYAESALETIVEHAVGWGIVAEQDHELWRRWTESTEIDADGDCDMAAMQKLVLRSVAESGEVLVRRRWRRPDDGLAIPMQLEVLEADHLDTGKDGRLANGNRVVQGVEFDLLGRRAAYWLFPEHPGASLTTSSSTMIGFSVRVPAREVLHIYRKKRPKQVRGPSWFAPVLLRFKDFDEFEDATLMKQKIAACLAVLTTDVDGATTALGKPGEEAGEDPLLDMLEPGMIANVPPGRSVEVIQPPSVAEYGEYSKTSLRAIATGLGVAYEDLTGDYTGMPFSAARMSRMRHRARVAGWQWNILVLQFLNPVWQWAMEAVAIAGAGPIASTEWTAPALPMVDPDKEGLALMRRVRAGTLTLSEAIRELGYNPRKFLQELANDFELLDELGLVLDSDPRKMTQQGQLQSTTAKPSPNAPPEKKKDDDDEEEDDE